MSSKPRRGGYFLALVTRFGTATSASNATGAVTVALVLVAGAFFTGAALAVTDTVALVVALALLLAVGAVKSLAPVLAVRRFGAAVSVSPAGGSSTLTARVVRVARALGFRASSSAPLSSEA